MKIAVSRAPGTEREVSPLEHTQIWGSDTR